MPAYVLRAIAENGDDEDRPRALAALALIARLRRGRQALAGPLPVRTEGKRGTRDAAVNEADDGAAKTYDFFRRVYGRSSVHGLGIRGPVPIYRDGDGKYFHRFTASLDVTAHELTHGVTHHSAALGFTGQSGALAEHFSDVFGILTKQYWLKQSAAQSDWMIGADLITPRVNGSGLRSLKAPGTAYDDPILGRDPQPSHMRDSVKTHGDDRGVHVNCGIPNHAFYRVAIALGGNAWETAGKIWYRTLTSGLTPRASFRQCAGATWRAAGELYGNGSEPQDAVLAGWRDVGIDVRRAKAVQRRERFVTPIAAAELPYLV